MLSATLTYGSFAHKVNMEESNNSTKQESNIDSLEFVRLRIPRLIPIHLIIQVKGRTFTPEQFYCFQENQADNPDNFLYAMIDEDKKIKGYLYAFKDALDGSLFINTFSVDKEYWHEGKAIEKAIEFLRPLVKKIQAPRVFWCTVNKHAFIKMGFTVSKIKLMQYNIE